MQDPAIGCNETFLQERLSGMYLPYEDGKNRNVFIRDPQNSAQLLIGKVSIGLDAFTRILSNSNSNSKPLFYSCGHKAK